MGIDPKIDPNFSMGRGRGIWFSSSKTQFKPNLTPQKMGFFWELIPELIPSLIPSLIPIFPGQGGGICGSEPGV